jgi:hypothetical protein
MEWWTTNQRMFPCFVAHRFVSSPPPPCRYRKEAKMLREDDVMSGGIDERAQVVYGGERATLLPR